MAILIFITKAWRMKDALQVGEHNEPKKTVITALDQKIQQKQKKEKSLTFGNGEYISLYNYIHLKNNNQKR